jgi:hypothetical protein
MAGFGGGTVGGAVVTLILQDAGFNRELDRSRGRLRSFAGQGERSLKGFSGAAKAAFATAGLAVAAFAVSSIKAYQESETVLAELQRTISAMPQLVGETTEAFEEQAAALQEVTRFSDEEVIAADSVLARFQLTGDQIRELTPLILDYAQVVGVDAATAASNIGRALLGNTRALKAVGIEFKATGDRAADLDTIIGELEKRVSGAAETFGTTSAGQMAIFNNKINEVQETIGQALVPILGTLLDTLTFLMPVIQLVADNFQTLLLIFLGYQGLKFLPALLFNIALGLERIGLAAAGGKVLGMSAALSGLAAPLALVTGGVIALGIALEAMFDDGERLKDSVADVAVELYNQSDAGKAARRQTLLASGAFLELDEALDPIPNAIFGVTQEWIFQEGKIRDVTSAVQSYLDWIGRVQEIELFRAPTGGGMSSVQHGYHGTVTGPRMFFVEPGMTEHVDITPRTGGGQRNGSGGGGTTVVFHIGTYLGNDRAAKRELESIVVSALARAAGR